MTAHFLAVIPQDPQARLSQDKLTVLETALAEICGTDETRIKDFGDRLQFIDCGDAQPVIRCPSCAVEADLGWWGQRMDHAWDPDHGFHLCQFAMPCCGDPARLNELCYEPAQGFSTWFVSARQTEPVPLGQTDRNRLLHSAGIPLTAIQQSYR